MQELKVLTLNAWGLRYVSKDLDIRMNALGDELAKGDYDIVALQEIWSIYYYELLCEKVKHALPYTHYFYCGVAGSGCATFSRYPIIDTFFQKYLHNGYFWDLPHAGDWFGGKGVGCCVIKHPHKKIYFFNTHLHADYAIRNERGVNECRALQCYQLAQFVRRTTLPGDAVIVCGDLNHVPGSLGLRALLELSKLNDTCQIASSKPNECFTLNPKFNKYTNDVEVVSRIDHILSSDAFDCSTCSLALQKIPNTDLHFSDHEGYTVTLNIKDCDVNRPLEYMDGPASKKILEELLDVTLRGEQISNEIHWKKVYLSLFLFIMLILLPVISVDMFHFVFPTIRTWLGKGIFILQVVSVVFCVIYFWVNIIVRWTDVRIFRNVSSEIKVKLNVLQEVDDKKLK